MKAHGLHIVQTLDMPSFLSDDNPKTSHFGKALFQLTSRQAPDTSASYENGTNRNGDSEHTDEALSNGFGPALHSLSNEHAVDSGTDKSSTPHLSLGTI